MEWIIGYLVFVGVFGYVGAYVQCVVVPEREEERIRQRVEQYMRRKR